jgi:hypothetical protein
MIFKWKTIFNNKYLYCFSGLSVRYIVLRYEAVYIYISLLNCVFRTENGAYDSYMLLPRYKLDIYKHAL